MSMFRSFLFQCLGLAPLLVISALMSRPATLDADEAVSLPHVAADVANAMQDRDYAAAVAKIDEALATAGKETPADYLAYLKGRAFFYQQRYADAVLAFEAFAESYPDSKWARQARFAKALAFARSNEFQNAEQIFRVEAEALLSKERKDEIAQIYLQFANAYFEPNDKSKKPDFAKAQAFFLKAIEVAPETDARPGIDLKVGECFQKLKKLPEAIKSFAAIVESHPEHDLNLEARYRLGAAQLQQRSYVLARRTWQDMLDKHSGSEQPQIALAKYKLAQTYGMPRPGSLRDLDLGVTALRSFAADHPDHALSSRAFLSIAQAYQHHGQIEKAAETVIELLDNQRYADRDEVPEARYLLGVFYQGQKRFDEALEVWRDYLTKHPSHGRWRDAQTQVVTTEYLMAAEKRAEKKFEEARELWKVFLAKYPLDHRARGILLIFGQMKFEQKQFAAAIEDWRDLVAKFPKSDEASHAQMSIAKTLEEQQGQLEEALAEYKKLTWGSQKQAAKRRTARLTARHMTVCTDRTFRVNETPTVKLTSRNIEKVSVRAYRIDMRTYFRKMHLASNVESLDIALIDPDKTIEFEIPDYEKHKLCHVDIPLDVFGESPEEGDVMVVTVSGEELEATTMVVQTDLEIIVKSSRNELLVYAQNMRTGKPWADAQLLLSNGKKIYGEAKTNDDGVFHETFDELRTTDDVRVFAIGGKGSVASNRVRLNGLGVAQGLTDKGYIYTDRPVYRPGQSVNVRGVIRQVSDDTYKIEVDKKFELSVFDNRDRVIWTEEVSLNKFGSFHASFAVPSDSPQGAYRVQVVDKDQQAYEGYFSVLQYQLQNIQLAVETERSVFYRGEKVRGKIVAKYYYGAVLPNREIRYHLSGGRVFTATTDEQGEVEFELDTRDLPEDHVLSLIAELPEFSLTQQVPVVIAPRGFSLAVATGRSTYLSGESFEVSVTATDAEGKPTAQDLKLSVIKRTIVNGRTGESTVATRELKTDAKTGDAVGSFTLDEGGTYVLRVEGTDRFSNPITSESSIQVSGEDDKVRLRILASKHTFNVGDKPSIRIHWRDRPSAALVTYEAANVLGYRIVQLDKGVNKIEIPMTADMAPNFSLSVAVMIDPPKEQKAGKKTPHRRFNIANTSFNVKRDIVVSINGPKSATPGEEVSVEVTAVDRQKQPVVAELSLAMVTQALSDRFGVSKEIADNFSNVRRVVSLRTASSIAFTYKPKTTKVNSRLLAESERVVTEAEERSRLAELGDPFGNNVDVDESMADDLFDAPAPRLPEFEPQQQAASQGQYIVGNSISQMENARQGSGGYGGYGGGGGGGYGGSGGGYGGAAYGGAQPMQQQAMQMGSSSSLRQSNSAANWKLVNEKASNGVVAYFKNGEVVQYGRVAMAAGGSALVEQLQQAGAIVRPNRGNEETGYWNPAIVTDARGRATVKFVMPERSTSWKFVAQGVTENTLVGSSEQSIVAKKNLFGTLKLPASLTDGDTAQIQATIHNSALKKGKISVTLNTTVAGKKTTATKTLKAAGNNTHELAFDVTFARPQSATDSANVDVVFELIVSAGNSLDRSTETVPLRPYGISVFDVASGVADNDATAWVELPPEMPSKGLALQVVVGPSVENSLLEALLAPPMRCQLFNSSVAPASDSQAADLLAAVALQDLFGKSRDHAGPQSAAIDVRIRSSLGSIVSSQRDDGGWNWAGTGVSNRYSTARMVWALSAARDAGYRIPSALIPNAISFLQAEMVKIPNTDYESKAVLLHALAVVGKDNFPLANRLYRSRQSLSTDALLYLTLTFAEMERLPMAEELIEIVRQRNLNASGSKGNGKLSFNHSAADRIALYAVALQKVNPKSPLLKEQIDWLKQNRYGYRWAPDRATGPAVVALCKWAAQSRYETARYSLELLVNDKSVRKLEVNKDTLTQSINVPAEYLVSGKQRVNLRLTGRGRYTYQCVLEGFVPAEHLKPTSKEWRIRRFYEAAPLERDGRSVPRGFDVVSGKYKSFKNELNEIPIGRRGRVTLNVWRPNANSSMSNDQLEYLVITEPLPAGVSVVENSVKGGFDRFEIGPGEITFFVGNRRSIGNISYEVHGFVSGDFKTTPPVIRDAYQLDRFAVGEAKELRVLPVGKASSDPYRLTPRELLELGKRHFDRSEPEAAIKHLTELEKNWSLQAKHYREVTRMLLDSHLSAGPADQVVRHFEVIKERWPDMEITYDKILKIGAAYHDIGEFERSYLIFRATVQSSFLTESQVAGFLQNQDELRQSVSVMNWLIREYPPEPYIATATFDLAQEVYAMAPKARTNKKLRAKTSRIDLIRDGMKMLNGFLTAYPNDPAADQAAFSLASALLELKKYDQAIAACSRFVSRYSDSADLDGFWYTIGYCHFALGHHNSALEICKDVAEMKRKDPKTGRMVEASNRDRAIYISGQIHHSLGQAADAIKHYSQVSEKYADAKEAITYFSRRDITLPEVTTIRPGEPVTAELEFRNIAQCETRVYKIDLMKFSLMQRNLSGIKNINLAGISPLHQETIVLGDGKDYDDRKYELGLPLTEEGAYLVVCRGGELHTSGLVLVSPLEVEVQEDAVAGRVRTTVKDAVDASYVSDVHVKVIGTANDDFVAGQTDLRGLFVADGILGKTTVIAQTDSGEYAFHRGKQHLGEVVVTGAGQMPAGKQQRKSKASVKGLSNESLLLEGIQLRNSDIQRGNSIRQQDLYNNDNGGVTVESVK